MAKNKYDLPEERLTTTDELGHRVYLYPEDVKGRWRNRRTLVFIFLLFIFLVLPWMNFDGKQIILLDLIKREFTFFGTTFFAHDSPMILLIFLLFIFTMGLATSLYGRVWCGWACPQTVFIDLIFRRIERWIEGRAIQREKLDNSHLTFSKFLKKSLKWILFTIVSLHISHSFLGYFVGARNLFWITMSSPVEHFELFMVMVFLTLLTLFDFGWFREQFCLIACPYGRIQSVIMDENSLVVAYDEARGEPRKAHELPKSNQGECVNCYACVKACPTGIDIRRGNQLECIACTNCIDACDEIMLKVGKDSGLIRYDRESNLKGKKVKKFGFRQMVYIAAILVAAVVFVLSIINSQTIKIQFIRAKTPFIVKEMVDSVEILNQFKITVDYKEKDLPNLKIKLDDTSIDKVEVVTPINPYPVRPGHQVINIFFKFDKKLLKNGAYKLNVLFFNENLQKEIINQEVTLVGPIE